MRAYIHDGLDTDQRLAHDTGINVAAEELEKVGVFYRHLTDQASVDALAKERNYKNRDVVTVTVEGLGGPEAYAEKLRIFYAEHLHDDEEIRYVLDGDGYFDVRNRDDKWIRVHVEQYDLLILPPGIFHRFTPAASDYIKALRLFKDEPKWEARPRSLGAQVEQSPSRQEYLAALA